MAHSSMVHRGETRDGIELHHMDCCGPLSLRTYLFRVLEKKQATMSTWIVADPSHSTAGFTWRTALWFTEVKHAMESSNITWLVADPSHCGPTCFACWRRS